MWAGARAWAVCVRLSLSLALSLCILVTPTHTNAFVLGSCPSIGANTLGFVCTPWHSFTLGLHSAIRGRYKLVALLRASGSRESLIMFI